MTRRTGLPQVWASIQKKVPFIIVGLVRWYSNWVKQLSTALKLSAVLTIIIYLVPRLNEKFNQGLTRLNQYGCCWLH